MWIPKQKCVEKNALTISLPFVSFIFSLALASCKYLNPDICPGMKTTVGMTEIPKHFDLVAQMFSSPAEQQLSALQYNGIVDK